MANFLAILKGDVQHCATLELNRRV